MKSEWETIEHQNYGVCLGSVQRMRIPGGWLYRCIDENMVFVPRQPGERMIEGEYPDLS